ncbi:MAG: hypothetical protein Q7S51_06590 [Gallionellaceae bacterium]|nr:hypothetical protein [Gallionellaceae bacterium]
MTPTIEHGIADALLYACWIPVTICAVCADICDARAQSCREMAHEY